MSEVRSSEAEWHVAHGDFFKCFFDYLKHLSTLATGTILLLATFLEKIFAKPLGAWLVGLSVVALFASLLASIVTYTILVLNFPRPNRNDLDGRELHIVSISLVTTLVLFVLGIGAIAVFFLVNWFTRS